MRYERLYERFLNFVVKTTQGCWKWKGKLDHQGYAVLAGVKAARISWEIYRGEIPDEICVLHVCDNPECTRPKCLWLGTKGDNNRDRAEKGRNKFAWDILTIEQVKSIRRESKFTSQRALAKKYGVSGASIWQIVTRKSYKYVN